MKNPMCDGSGPCDPGQVRVLPMGKNPHHGNLILCRCCFDRERRWRQARNSDLAPDCRFDLPYWDSLKVYGEDPKPPGEEKVEVSLRFVRAVKPLIESLQDCITEDGAAAWDGVVPKHTIRRLEAINRIAREAIQQFFKSAQ